MTSQTLYGRKVGLLVYSSKPLLANQKGNALDLSDLHFTFKVEQNDNEQPNNARIRIYNLSEQTIAKIQGEFDSVVLEAGYVNAAFGVIFKGSIKQYGRGKENATDTYFDILAADGDPEYNFGIVNATLDSGSTDKTVLNTVVNQMGLKGIATPLTLNLSGRENIRPKVLFGMGRVYLRQVATTNFSSWSIQNGVVQIVQLNSYLPNELVVLTSETGMVGIPELTDEGVKVVSLLNPKLVIGGLIQIDNKSLNKILQQNPSDKTFAPVFNKYAGVQANAYENADGIYKILVVEYEGDTRGNPWYSNIIAIAVNAVGRVVPLSQT